MGPLRLFCLGMKSRIAIQGAHVGFSGCALLPEMPRLWSYPCRVMHCLELSIQLPLSMARKY